MTKLKESFLVLAKDKDENLTDKKQRVDVLMKGTKSSNASIVAAKTKVFKDYRLDLNAATSVLSGLILNIHSGAQLDYANRHSGKKRCMPEFPLLKSQSGQVEWNGGSSVFITV